MITPMRDHRLTITILIAVLVLIGTSTAMLLLDPRVTSASALRTAGLAAGSIVAMYALWLNDRRRQIEEQRQELDRRREELDTERYALERRRHELEDQRSEHDRDRIADERFARAIELLGNEADQVRVGALHATAGLARNRPDYTQTVLDVLCAYLRRPFEHPRYARNQREREWSAQETNYAERELEVRLTAQRLLTELLPRADQQDAPAYDVDLTRASLEYLDLSGRRIGRLYLRYGHLYSSTNLSGCHFLGTAWFTGMTTGTGTLSGLFRCADTVFTERAWFSGVALHGPTYFDRTHFQGRAKFAGSTFGEQVSITNAIFDSTVDFRDTHFSSPPDLRLTTCHGEVHSDGTFDITQE